VSIPSIEKPLRSVLPALLLIGTAAGQPIPAFPGAEGYGGYAKGGRGGDVYIVTNLNASGAGSFRNGIETVPAAGRTIVFAVSGHIHINGLRLTGSKVTIAGQTAPGDGVGLVNGTFRISSDDVVVRHMRFRHRKSGSGGDCVNLDSGSINSVLDSISMQFSTDENFSSYGSPPENLTMQWSLNAWGLESHSCGGLWDQNHATAHHTLWAHNHTRNPKARPNGLLEWINNVTFDWDIGFIMGDSATPASWKANVRNSYFLCPPGNLRSRALEKANLDRNGNPNFSLYLNNCRHDNNGDGILNGTDKGYSIASGNYVTLASPVANTGAIPVTMDDPVVAFKKVVSKAGALRLEIDPEKPLRDEVDAKLIHNLVTQTANHISNESQLGLTNGGIGTLNSAAAPLDADLDGMPDYYETALGWNPAVQDHNTALANSGGFVTGTTFLPPNTRAGAAVLEKYTRLEEYLHFLAIPHGTVAKNTVGEPTQARIDLRKFTSGFSSSPVFTVSNITGGGIVQSGTGNCIATFTPTLNYSGRARFDFTVTDSAGHSWTQTCALLVTNAALPRDLSWKGSGSVWDGAAQNWLRQSDGTTVAFETGDRVVFDQAGIAQPVVSLSGPLAPTTVEVNAAGNYTFAGAGSVGSTGSLTKRGPGALTLNSAHTYAAGTSLEEGSLVIGSGGGLAGAVLTLLDGTMLTNGYPTGTTLGISPRIEVPAGHSATLNSGNRLSLSGGLTGGGTLNCRVQTTVNRFDFYGATAAFSGNLNFSQSGGVRLFFNGGSFNGFDSAKLDVGGSVILQPQTNSGGNTLRIGALSGSSTAAGLAGGTAGAVAYVVGAGGTDTTFAGGISGNATLTKTGTGTLTLSGANSHTGATSVESGALLIDGSLGNTAVTVASGALLGGDGTIGGAVTAAPGAFLSPGTVPFTGATMNLTRNLTLNGSTMYCDMAGTPAGVSDRIVMNGGTLALAGPLHFQFLPLDGTLAAGTYDLISGASNSSAGGVSLTHNLPSGTRQTFAVNRSAAGSNPSRIWLVVTGDPATLTWTGATSANWDTTTANNWKGANPNTFGTHDAVVFDDSASVLNITPAGTVLPRSTLVNNTSKAFTLNAGIGGGVLTKSGAARLILTGSNSHSGTVLDAGTLELANATANATALGAGTVTLNGGTLKMYSAGDATGAGNLSNALHVAGNATFQPAPRCVFSGGVSGNGTLNYHTTYVRADITGNWSAFSGNLNVTTDAGGGDFRITASYSWPGLPAASVHLAANTWFYHAGILASGAGTTIEIGALAGAANSHLRGGVTGGRALTYRIGGRNTDAIFAGDIAEQNTSTATNIEKTGTGSWTLSGAGKWNGGTTVDQGILRISGTIACGGATSVEPGASLKLDGGSLTTDATNIAAGATLSGHGTLVSDLNAAGAIEGRGFASGTPGVLAVEGSAFIGSNAVIRMLAGVTSDVISVSGDLSLGGTLQVSLAPVTEFGRYPLIVFTGDLTGAAGLAGIPAGTTARLSTSVPGRVDLVIDDSDEDGLPDSWELLKFGNLSQGPNGDRDADGTSNLAEYRLGLDPGSGGSAFRVTCSKGTLSWPSAPGVVFTIRRNASLDPAGWRAIGTVTGGPEPTATFTDPESFERAFYQISFEP
jgi:autotransporter-associated beta strand protein